MYDEIRRLRREAIRAIPSYKRALEDALRAALEPDERLEAVSVGRWIGRAITVRRLVIARGGLPNGPPSVESFTFDELQGWHLGWTHDERPYVVLRHQPRLRPEHAPAHRLLWLEWGNRTVAIPRETRRIPFATRRDPVFLALTRTLEGLRVAREPTIHERPEGSREDRSGTVVPYLSKRRDRILRPARRRPPWARRGPAPR